MARLELIWRFGGRPLPVTPTVRAIVEACVGQRTIIYQLLNGERVSHEQEGARRANSLPRRPGREMVTSLTDVVGQLRGTWRPIAGTSGSVGQLRSVAPAVAPADHSAGMA